MDYGNRPETELSLLALTDRCPFFPRLFGGFPLGDHMFIAMEECGLGTLGAYDLAPYEITWEDRYVVFRIGNYVKSLGCAP